MSPLNNYLFVLFFALFLAACGGGSSGDDSDEGNTSPDNADTTPRNVAAASNGATVSSNYSGNESFTIDEDTSTTNYWSGGASGDYVKVAFDRLYAINEITIWTNSLGFSVVDGGATLKEGISLELSDDDTTYYSVALALGYNGPISCNALLIGNGKITCTLSPALRVTHVKVGVTDNFESTQIYEIEAMGVPSSS